MNANVKSILVYIQEAMAKNGQSPNHTYITFCRNDPFHINEACKQCKITQEELFSALREALSLDLIYYRQRNVKAFHQLYFTKTGIDMVCKIKTGTGEKFPNVNFERCNVQVGDYNTMNVQEMYSQIESMIEKSTSATPEQKEEAKGVLRILSENPLFAASASQYFSAIAKSFGIM